EIGHVVLGCAAAVLIGVVPTAAIGPVIGRHSKASPDGSIDRLQANSRKEGGQLVKLFALPAIVRMVVTLGALNLNAEKDASYFRGRLLGAAIMRHVNVGRTILTYVPATGNELFGHLIPGGYVVQFLGEHCDHGVRCEQGTIFET